MPTEPYDVNQFIIDLHEWAEIDPAGPRLDPIGSSDIFVDLSAYGAMFYRWYALHRSPLPEMPVVWEHFKKTTMYRKYGGE